MKRLLLSIFVLLGTIHCFSQSKNPGNTEAINAIKLCTDYIYAESTAKTMAEAYENAKLLLETYIEDWAKKEIGNNNTSGFVTRSKEHLQQIDTRRGELFRAFIYVKKSDILSFVDNNQIIVIPAGPSNNTTQQDISSKPSEVIKKLEDSNISHTTNYVPNYYEKQMLELETLADINTFINKMEKLGIVDKYGRYSTLPSSGDYYIIIFNSSGNVISVIKRYGTKQINLETGIDDNVKNYTNCQAIWLHMKQ